MTREPMQRRTFITLLGGAAAMPLALWPLAARAQQPAMPVIGYIDNGTPEAGAGSLVALRKGLAEMGYTAAAARGLDLHVFAAGGERDLEPAFAAMARQRVGALIVNTDPHFLGLREQIVTLAARHAVPTIYIQREFPAAGGLLSYGPDRLDSNRARFSEPLPEEDSCDPLATDPARQRLRVHLTCVGTDDNRADRVNFSPDSPNSKAAVVFPRYAAGCILCKPVTPGKGDDRSRQSRRDACRFVDADRGHRAGAALSPSGPKIHETAGGTG
jgi:hypothetical protein